MAVGAGGPWELRPRRKRARIGDSDEHERNKMQDEPKWLGPGLEAADEGDAVGHQRNDHQRADHVADEQRHAEAHLQRERHDRGFDGEEQKRERGIDQRRDGRADVAEAGAAREQVDVDAIGRGVVGDRQAGQENEAADDQDRGGRVDEAVIDGDRSADRFERQEGHRTDGGIGDAGARPFSRALGGEAQRVVLERLVRDPLIVVAANPDDSLLRCHCRPSAARSCCPCSAPGGVSLVANAVDAGARLHRELSAPPRRPRGRK